MARREETERRACGRRRGHEGTRVAPLLGVRIGMVGLLLATTAITASADTVTIGASRDTTLYGENGALSNGSGQYIFTGVTEQNAQRRALLAFDIAAAIPAGSTITGATLTLRLTRTRTQNLAVSLHAVSADWGEGASDASGEEGAGAPAQTGDATWTMRVYPSTAWSTPGGTYTSGASATTTIGNNLVDYTWSSNSMVADVQAWLATPSANAGWIVIAPSAGTKETKRFASRNNIDPAVRPRLTITFTAPPLSGACCASDGGCTIVANPGTSCTGSYQGNGSSCTPNACPQPTGACCANDATATCTEVAQGSCAGTFRGLATSCSATTCPVVLTPFVDPLPIPRVAQPVSGTAGGAASYELKIVQLQRKMHSALPPTTLWGFDDGAGASSPGPTIEARTGDAINMRWTNDLRDNGTLRTTHYMPIDDCITTSDAPRTVIHLHGGHVPVASDGYPEATFLPGQSVDYTYPNQQPAATLWYHDHAMGITRLNVMMGLAGFYLVRDPAEQALGLPSGSDEIPLVISDRSFEPTGRVVYPAMWMSHFFGDTLLVNGVVWPYLQVKRGKYRFRILDGSTSRTYTLALSNGASFFVIGTDGGLLAAPVSRTSLTLQPGERADIVVDFASYAAGTEIVLTNSAPAPYPGIPGMGVVPNVMKFIVGSTMGTLTALPSSLVPVTPFDPATATITRDLVLKKRSDTCTGEAWTINGLSWDDITERPTLDTNEIWRFINASGDSHPMHLHLVQFQLIDRQPFAMINGVPVATGPAVGPQPFEAGWKDTIDVEPDEIVRIIARFTDYTGKYPYHCHILEHEDRDMMRQFEVIAAPTSDAGIDPDAGLDPDGGVDDDASNPNNGAGGGGCCQTDRDSKSGVALAALVAFALRRRRRRRSR